MGYPLLEIESKLAGSRSGTRTDLTSTPFGVEVGDATKIVSTQIGVSKTTFDKAIKIIKKGTELEKENCRSGKQSINYVYKEIKKQENIENIHEEGSDKKYQMIKE